MPGVSTNTPTPINDLKQSTYPVLVISVCMPGVSTNTPTPINDLKQSTYPVLVISVCMPGVSTNTPTPINDLKQVKSIYLFILNLSSFICLSVP